MLFAINMLAVLVLGFFAQPRIGGPEVWDVVHSPEARRHLLSGDRAAFEERVRAHIAERIAMDLKDTGVRGVNPASVAQWLSGGKPGETLSSLTSLIAVVGLVAEVQSLGASSAIRRLLEWADNGLTRKLGLSRADFPSYFSIVLESESRRAPLSGAEVDRLTDDRFLAQDKSRALFIQLRQQARERAPESRFP